MQLHEIGQIGSAPRAQHTHAQTHYSSLNCAAIVDGRRGQLIVRTKSLARFFVLARRTHWRRMCCAGAPGLVRRCCYESRRESKVTRRGYANSGRTRQWHHHRACGGRVNVRRLLPLLLQCCCLWHPSSGACTTHAPAASNLRAPTRPMARRPRRGTQRRTRHRRMTTVSSTSSFCSRRRRRRLLGRQAAGRGTTFGAGCAARRAASASSPPHHLHSTRAHSAPSVGRSAGTSWPDLGVRAHLLRSASASRRAAKGACRSMASGEIVLRRA